MAHGWSPKLALFASLVAVFAAGSAHAVCSGLVGDINCDNDVTVADVQIAILLTLQNPLSPVLDSNGDGEPDACECGDGVCEPDLGEDCEMCPEDCGECPSTCCTDASGAGCDDFACADAVCELDETCCSLAWDKTCENKALGLCGELCEGVVELVCFTGSSSIPSDDDVFGDNDTSGTALDIESLGSLGPSVKDALCAGDPDYYSTEVRRGCDVNVAWNTDLDGGTPQVALFAPGNIQSFSLGTIASQTYSTTALHTGDWTLRLLETIGNPAVVEVEFDEECTLDCPDAFEPNQSTSVAPDIPSDGTQTYGVLCGVGDNDFFRIEAPPLCQVEVTLEPSGDVPSYGIGLVGAGGGSLGGPSSGFILGPGTVLKRTATVPASGEVFAWLGPNSTASVGYFVSAEVTCPLCADDDEAEPNNNISQAWPLEANEFFSGQSCGDADLFSLEVPGGCTASALLVGGPGDPMTLQLGLDDGVGGFDTQNTTTVEEPEIKSILAATSPPTTWYTRVSTPSGAASEYDLMTSYSCAFTCPADDPHEPNEVYNTSVPRLFDGDVVHGISCPTNPDTFWFSAGAGCSVTATANSDNQLYLDLYANGTFLDIDTTEDAGVVSVSGTASFSTTMFLRAHHFSSMPTTYDLSLAIDCP